MSRIDIAAIERRARQLRAEEMRRVEGLFAERLCVMGRLAAESSFNGVLAVAELLRKLFSWNPQATPVAAAAPVVRVSLKTRANRALRALFAWNPEAHHHF